MASLAGRADGHHLVNRSDQPATYLEIGSRSDVDEVVYSDIDMELRLRGGDHVPGAGTVSPTEGARAELRKQVSLEEHMVKPIMNLDDVEFDDIEENGIYTSSCCQISDHIGAKKLGYNLTVLPPGKVQCPFHCHHGEEEMFLIIEGEGELRFGERDTRSASTM